MISCASCAAAFLDRVQARVEHQRDSGERLHGAVVQLVRKTPALVLLGGDAADPTAASARPRARARRPAAARSRARARRSPPARSRARRRRGRRALAGSDRSAPISSSCARSGITIAFSAGACRGRSPGREQRARASNSRSASWRVRSSTSAPPAIDPIVSTSDSRKRASLVSSRSAASCRRRSVTIRNAATTPAIAIVSAERGERQRMAADRQCHNREQAPRPQTPGRAVRL